jgi:hypothetical protein
MSSFNDLDLAASKRGVSFNTTSPAVLGLVIFSPVSPLTKHDFLMGPAEQMSLSAPCHARHLTQDSLQLHLAQNHQLPWFWKDRDSVYLKLKHFDLRQTKFLFPK